MKVNSQMVKYVIALATSGVISTCSFSMYLDKMKFGKHKTKKIVADIPEKEIEPDFEDDFEEEVE